ncbi:uncharacterized protein TNCT_362871, partial [Trichonephila clavata]
DQIPFIKCINDGAAKCETKFVKDAKEWYETNVDACKEGSKLNKAIKENEECITKATSESNCFSEVGFDLKEMSRDEAGCKELKKVEDCLYRKVKSECSRNVVIIFLRMYHPMVRLQLKICYARGYLKN